MAVSQSSVHYRFGNNSEFKTLSFDGIHIAVDELKKSVAAQEGINLEYVDFTLTNANTKRVYEGSNIIPRNSCVVVARVPREHPVKLPKVSNTENSGIIQIGFNNNGSKTGHINQEAFNKMTEQERILHAIAQSTEKYDPSNYKKRVTMSMNAKASPDHVCNKCNKLGHFPKQCPMLNYRLSTGIPSEELMETTQDDPNAMYHPSGRYVIPIMHYKARETRKLVDKVNYERSKLLNGASPYQSANSSGEAEKPSIPDELKCPLCNDLLTEALLAPCCGESFCAMCIHDVMLKGSLTEDGSRCPTCVPPKPISADSLIPNKRVRDSVVRWKNNTAEHSPPGGSGSGGSVGTPRIASPIPLSAVVLEQKASAAAGLNGSQVHEIPPAIVKLPTVNLSAMLAQNNKQLPPAPTPAAAVMAPMFMPPVATSGTNSTPASILTTLAAPPPARLDSSSSSETVNRIDNSNARPSTEPTPIASTSTTSSTAAPPGLSESVYQHEPVYKCPTVTDPQIQADEDAMSRAWDVVFNTDETLDIFDLHKTRTSTTDKDKDTNKSKRRSDDRDSRRDYRDRDASSRRKERSRSRDRERDRHGGGHRERRDEEDSRVRHGRTTTDHRRYDDRDRRRGERERDRYHKEDRYVGSSSRKRTRSRSKSPDRKRHRSDSRDRERKYDVDSREKKKASERSLTPVKKHARSRTPEKVRRSRSKSHEVKRRHSRTKSPQKHRRSRSRSPLKRRSRSKSPEKKSHARSKSPKRLSRAKSVEQKPESVEIDSLTDDLLVVPTKERSATPMEVDLPASQEVPKLDRANSSDSTFFPSDNSESDLLKLSEPVQNPPKIEVTIRSFQLPEAEPSPDLWKKQYAESVPEEPQVVKSPIDTSIDSVKPSPSPEVAPKKDDSEDDDRSTSKSKKKKKDKKRKHRHSSDESESERTEKKKKKKDKKKKHRSDDESDDGRSEKKKKHKKKHKKHRHEAGGDASDTDKDKKKKKKEKKKDRRSEDRVDKTSRRSEERSEKKSRRSEDRIDKKADRDRDSRSHRRHHDDDRVKEESSRKRTSPRRERSSRDYRRR